MLTAIGRFYTHCNHTLRFTGLSFPSVILLSGVRQGCPMSPVIFAICSDLLLRLLSRILGCRPSPSAVAATLRAFADDTGLTIPGITRRLLLRLSKFFDLWHKASALELNDVKNVLVPINVSEGRLH